jgi:hypothetical protein
MGAFRVGAVAGLSYEAPAECSKRGVENRLALISRRRRLRQRATIDLRRHQTFSRTANQIRSRREDREARVATTGIVACG